MSALEQSIRDICAAHNLQSFQVGFLIPNDKWGVGWSVGLQRWDGDTPVGCWSGDGTSIAAALSDALAKVPVTSALADEPIEVAA